MTVCGGARPGPRGEFSSAMSMSESSNSSFPPGEMPSPRAKSSRPVVLFGDVSPAIRLALALLLRRRSRVSRAVRGGTSLRASGQKGGVALAHVTSSLRVSVRNKALLTASFQALARASSGVRDASLRRLRATVAAINFQVEPLALHLTLASSTGVQHFKVADWAFQLRRVKV